MKKKLYSLIALVATFHVCATAQVCEVTFDTDDYNSVGVYDAWENSPFRSGTLQGNAAVIDNPHTEVSDILGTAPNPTAKVLGVQRSRYGSNQFGARIDLKTPFSLKPETQYVHVLVHRPVNGRVMLMGLGKHREPEWAGQSAETEQFWAISTTNVAPGMWADAVFAIKGVSGVDIHSLVLVPECESPHDRTEDFIAYIDQIVVNNSSAPLVSYDEYPVNFNKDSERASRTDRGILSVGLQDVSTLTITSSPTTSDPLYRDRMDATLAVKAGQSVKPVIGYKGTWMCGYAYVDFGRDGKFSYAINADGTPADGSDLVAYSAYNLRNSAGATLSNNNSLNIPAFTIPATTPTGFYRMRFKVDWNEIDPGGSATIKDDGGGVVDVRLNVHTDNVSVVEDNRNGEILNADGTPLVSTTAFGEALAVKLNPENGFSYNGIRIRHGYGLTGDSLVHGTPQYVDEYVWRDQFDANDCYTIKAEWVDGDLLLEGLFVEKGTEIEFNYPINYDKATATISRTDRRMNGATMAGTTWTLPAGKKLYNEDMSQTFIAKAGEQMQVQFAFTGNWMNSYLYIDRDQDGDFSYNINTDGTPAEGSDLMTYSHYNLKNSAGQSLTGSARNVLNPPAFTMPALPDGFYAVRFKVDWNEIDPGGNTTDDNNIIHNGGGIADARLRVFSGTEVGLALTEHSHGTLTAIDGEALPETVAFNTPLTLLAAPYPGYRIDSLYVTHGDFNAPKQYVHGVPQWVTHTYTYDDFFEGAFTLPANILDGDIRLHPTFVADENYHPTTPTLSAEVVQGGLVQDALGVKLTAAPVTMPDDQDATILLYSNTGYQIGGLHIVSSNGEEAQITPGDLNINRYDIPAAFFADNGQVVVTPTFTPLPEGETRSRQHWRYVWGDEFESENNAYAKPATAKWRNQGRSSATWARFIADHDSVSFVRDGYYHARCIPNPDTESDNVAMLSGNISSRGIYSFKYGRVEARIKTTRHKGNFPAFWMMPQDNTGGWPIAGEIDIWEQIDTQNKAHHTIHTNWTYNLGNKNNPKSTSNETVDMDQWHVYALEWDDMQLRWYVDGVQVFSYTKKADDADALDKGQWPFDKEFYVILNQSVGNGSWASNPDVNFTYETLFDYVRVYQIQKSGTDNRTYPINYPKAQPVKHATRRLTAVGLDDQTVSVPNPACIYNFVDEPVFVVAPGQTVQPYVEFSTGWMHAYVYLDLDGDSLFTVIAPTSGVQPTLSELMSYSFYSEGDEIGNGYNSAGTAIPSYEANTMALPTFTVPTTMAPGLYRIRFKVDWDNTDAGGSTVAGNDMYTNGGAICDVNICVEDPTGITTPLQSPADNDWHDLQGRRINAPTTPGIYLRGGRKVLVK